MEYSDQCYSYAGGGGGGAGVLVLMAQKHLTQWTLAEVGGTE